MLHSQKLAGCIALLASCLLLAADDVKPRTFLFGKADLDKVPAGWKVDRTGKGDGSSWKVVEDRTAPSSTGYVLAQTAASPKAMFNLCVVEDSTFKDGDISVEFKAVKGEVDQGGGIVWRYQNADNYYICRMNPLENNFRVYRVVEGKRTQLESKEDIKVKAGEWHKISIKMTGSQIECSLDGRKYLTAKDDTFSKAGKVGLWSKADAQTYFDDFKVIGK